MVSTNALNFTLNLQLQFIWSPVISPGGTCDQKKGDLTDPDM